MRMISRLPQTSRTQVKSSALILSFRLTETTAAICEEHMDAETIKAPAPAPRSAAVIGLHAGPAFPEMKQFPLVLRISYPDDQAIACLGFDGPDMTLGVGP